MLCVYSFVVVLDATLQSSQLCQAYVTYSTRKCARYVLPHLSVQCHIRTLWKKCIYQLTFLSSSILICRMWWRSCSLSIQTVCFLWGECNGKLFFRTFQSLVYRLNQVDSVRGPWPNSWNRYAFPFYTHLKFLTLVRKNYPYKVFWRKAK